MGTFLLKLASSSFVQNQVITTKHRIVGKQ